MESRLEYLREDMEWLHLVPIILLSFQAPGQVCAARALGWEESSTVVVTTMVYDFASDAALFKRGWTSNLKRNRRFAGFAFMITGAIAGGWVTVWTRHVVVTLWVAAAIKGAMTVAWVCWPAKR